VGPDGSIFVTFNSVSVSQTPAASATAGCPSSAPLHVLVASSHDHGRQFTTTLAQTACEDGTWIGTPVIGSSSYTGATWRLPSSTNTVVDPRTGVLVSVLGYQDGLTGHQRISLVTSRDHGAHWSAAGHVADLAGEEQQMPRLAVGADGRLSLVWIAQLPGGFTWPSHAWSRDDARTWSATQRISAAPNPRGGPGAQFFLGDYLGNDVGSDGRAHPVWTDPREIVPDEPGGTIYTRALVP
jgi:hypothetical protein